MQTFYHCFRFMNTAISASMGWQIIEIVWLNFLVHTCNWTRNLRSRVKFANLVTIISDACSNELIWINCDTSHMTFVNKIIFLINLFFLTITLFTIYSFAFVKHVEIRPSKTLKLRFSLICCWIPPTLKLFFLWLLFAVGFCLFVWTFSYFAICLHMK